MSLKAGGTGLNLTAASQVIHYDRWWNPAVEDQATDRAWRLGQQRTVNVHKLVCQGTVEERIGEVIDEKRAIADAVIGTGEAWLSELSTDELARLVMLDGPHDGGGTVSRPRKPYGPNPPGRLPATMIKVLAAELSDQGRLARGKRYWADHAVIDIVIGHGAVTAEIQGSRAKPYVVTIEANPGAGVPGQARALDPLHLPRRLRRRQRGVQARGGRAVRAVRRGRDRTRAARAVARRLAIATAHRGRAGTARAAEQRGADPPRPAGGRARPRAARRQHRRDRPPARGPRRCRRARLPRRIA